MKTDTMSRDHGSRFDEMKLLGLFLALLAFAACFAGTVLFAGWFVYIIGPVGLLLLLFAGVLRVAHRGDHPAKGAYWLAMVGGVLLSGPLVYLGFWLLDR